MTTPSSPRHGSSPLVGHQLGVYGPWVAEEAHGWRPEIHPSQALWWRDPASGNSAADLHDYHLLVVEDDSNRFDRQENFSGNVVRPWSKPPIDMLFRIAVRVPVGQILRINVEELFGRHVHDIGSSSPDLTLALEPHLSTLGGTQVHLHLGGNPRHLAVKFESFTERSHLTKSEGFRGYVALRCRVGKDDRGDEGYCALRVRQEIVSQVPAIGE